MHVPSICAVQRRQLCAFRLRTCDCILFVISVHVWGPVTCKLSHDLMTKKQSCIWLFYYSQWKQWLWSSDVFITGNESSRTQNRRGLGMLILTLKLSSLTLVDISWGLDQLLVLRLKGEAQLHVSAVTTRSTCSHTTTHLVTSGWHWDKRSKKELIHLGQ